MIVRCEFPEGPSDCVWPCGPGLRKASVGDLSTLRSSCSERTLGRATQCVSLILSDAWRNSVRSIYVSTVHARHPLEPGLRKSIKFDFVSYSPDRNVHSRKRWSDPRV